MKLHSPLAGRHIRYASVTPEPPVAGRPEYCPSLWWCQRWSEQAAPLVARS
ncbi:MAG: hypothetical protein ACMUIU_12285 [bacterium]